MAQCRPRLSGRRSGCPYPGLVQTHKLSGDRSGRCISTLVLVAAYGMAPRKPASKSQSSGPPKATAKRKRPYKPLNDAAKAAKARYERVRRGKWAAVVKAEKYHTDSGKKMWIVHETAGKIEYWSSEMSDDWPPQTQDVVCYGERNSCR